MFSSCLGNGHGGWLLKVLATLVVALAVTACTKSSVQLVESAKKREAAGDLSGAILDLKSALQREPNDASTRFLLGRLHNEKFDFAAAEQELRKARELGAVEGGRVLAELTRALRGLGKYKELIEEAKPSPAYEPAQLAIIHSLRGRASLAIGRLQEARADFAEATRFAADLPEVQLLDAQLRGAAGDIPAAEAIVDEVLRKWPSNFEALAYKAAILRGQGKREEALGVYTRMLEINPRHLQALINRVGVLLGLGKLDEAKKDVDTLVRLYKNHPLAHVQRGMWQLASNKPREALESAQLALKFEPQPPTANLLAGLAYLANGSAIQAEGQLSKYLNRFPQSAVARRALAEAWLHQNQPAKALEVLVPLLQSSQPDAKAYALSAEAHAMSGKLLQAAQFYGKAAELAPHHPGLRVRKATLRMGAGEFDQGLEELAGAVALTKSATQGDEILISGYVEKKRFDEAMAALDALDKRVPNSGLAANLRGGVLLAKGDRPLAIQAFEKALKLDPTFFPAAENLARLDLMAGKQDAARKRYEIVLKANENHLAALLATAELDAIAGNLKSSIELLRRAMSAHPKVLEPKMRLATAYVASNELQMAATVATDALAKHPDEPLALILAANVHMQAGSVNKALQATAQLAQIFPTPEAYMQLARVQGWVGSEREAEASLRKALQLNRSFAPAQIALSGLLFDSGRVKEALQFARGIQTGEPKAAIGYVLEGEILERQKKWADALEAFRVALQREPSGMIAASIYRVRARSGQAKEALDELDKWSERNPKDRAGRLTAAYAHLQAGNVNLAMSRYEALVQSNPQDSESLNGLAWVYHLAKDARALPTAQAAYALAPLSPNVQDTLGWILVKKGDIGRGLPLLRVAAQRLPGNPDVRFHLAAALHMAGDHAAAREELKALLATGNDFPSAREARELLASLK